MAQGSLDGNGHHVSFRRMPFADLPLRIRAGGVEVAQDARSKALVAIEVAQDLLDDELASTIRIDWALNVSLNDGCRQGNSVRGAGRGEDHFVYACSLRGPKQRYRSGDVVVIEAARVANRLTNLNCCCEMYDRLRLVFRKNLIDLTAIPNVT